jgi:hypothetical protein
MISEEKVEKALSWMVDNATKAAQARANRVYLEEYRKTVLATEMKASGENSAAAQEREALVSESYKTHLLGLREAVEKDEWNRWMFHAAEATIEAWRSMQANQRAQGKLT